MLTFLIVLSALILVLPLVGTHFAHPPVILISGTLAIVGILGSVAFTWLHLPHLPIENKLFFVPLDTFRTLLIFLTAGTSVMLGAAIASIGPTNSGRQSASVREVSSQTIKGISATPSWALVLAAIAPVALYIAGRGPTTLWRASTYLEVSGSPTLVKLGFAAIPLGMIASCFLAAPGRSSASRALAIGFIGLYALVAIAAATRALALLAPAYYLMARLSGAQRRTFTLVACGILTVAGLSLPVHLRSLPLHGFAPYGHAILEDPISLFSIDLPTVVSNVLIAFPLCNFVSSLVLPSGSLAASISPLPGQYSGWDVFLSSLRLNYYVPYSAIGESAAHGQLFLTAYYLIAGVIFARAWLSAGSMHGWRPWVVRIATLGLSGLFAVQTLQYNLRSVTRLEYYLVAFVLLCVTFDMLAQARQSHLPTKNRLASR